MNDNGEPMDKNAMMTLLKINHSKMASFFKEVVEANVIIVNDNGIFLNDTIFEKGSIKDKEKTDFYRIRLYVNSVRNLYNNADPREHKALSYIYQAIPFVNIHYNMLCKNQTERSLDKIIPMTLEEYCEIIGYSTQNYRRLKSNLMQYTFKGKPVFSFVQNNTGTFCYVNPKVYYAGSEWDKVIILGYFENQNTI